MEWNEDGIILGARQHSENDVILQVMTYERGRCGGLVRGGKSRRLRPVLQAGNSVNVTWRARLEDHLGQFSVEPVALRAASLMQDRGRLSMANLLCSYLILLPERDPHPRLFQSLVQFLETMPDGFGMAHSLFGFEMALLDELGFGLDLSECAATGVMEDLAYVSPKSGRAVSREAGAPYHDKLLTLPGFVHDPSIGNHQRSDDWEAAFKLTGFFLDKHIFEPRGLKISEARTTLLRGLRGILVESASRKAAAQNSGL